MRDFIFDLQRFAEVVVGKANNNKLNVEEDKTQVYGFTHSCTARCGFILFICKSKFHPISSQHGIYCFRTTAWILIVPNGMLIGTIHSGIPAEVGGPYEQKQTPYP